MKVERKKRILFPENFKLNSFEDLVPYINKLKDYEISNQQSFIDFLCLKSEFDAVLEENAAWRYIKMTIDTSNEDFAKSYSFFTNEIQPKLAPIEDELNQKINACPYKTELEQKEEYFIYFRAIKTSIDLYKEENISLETKVSDLTQEYGAINGKQEITYKDKTYTLQQASIFLKDQDETVRKEVFDLISNRKKEDITALNTNFDALTQLRNTIAKNAGFDNFRDYKFKALQRFDYSVEDCFSFHKAIKKHIVPLSSNLTKKRAEKLNKTILKPWDLDVDPDGNKPLKPFETAEDLLENSIALFKDMDEYFGNCIATLKAMNHVDLSSKKGKAPGGYNYPLYEIGVPFIFMNAVGAQRDLETMVHESGHAIHSFLSRDLLLTGFKDLPSEVAELASMSMELFTMDFWHYFYKDEQELKRAKINQLESILKVLPWIAIVDAFQHWIYTNPNHTQKERNLKWLEINEGFGSNLVDWTGYEDIKENAWHKQLHIFEVPFYYIEYGIAQLGAIALYRNYKKDPKQTLQQYKQALALGYSKSIPEIYTTAGISFDFSEAYIAELAQFINEELAQLYK